VSSKDSRKKISTARVIIDDPPTMSLLGLLMGSIIERRSIQPEGVKRLEKLRGALVVEAGTMTITLQFAEGKVTVLRGAIDGARARVRGSMEALLNISLGKGMVGPWLSGRIKTKGSLLMLLRVLPLMRA
jgi:SCP-2 sterol transfer family